MPKISEEQRASRRLQILNAAWTCFSSRGLHETTMADIIRAADLSSGAVYLYFSSKEEIILAAISMSLGGIRSVVEPIFARDDFTNIAALIQEIAAAIDRYSVRDSFDLRSIAILGWSEAQTNPRVKEAVAPFYRTFLSLLAKAIDRGQTRGVADHAASSGGVATLVLSVLLGNVVQSTLLGNHSTAKIERAVGMMQPSTRH